MTNSRRSVNRRAVRRTYRRVRYLVLTIALLILVGLFAVIVSARTTGAAAKKQIHTYKYYESYMVQGGDTLYSIAADHMTDDYACAEEYVEEVCEINHIQGDYLRSGSTICIPYYSDEYKA